ncbi:hypothetical protein [Paracoccus sp. Z118]|nr:hypothetical protein [Paracoccus sp. Z118]
MAPRRGSTGAERARRHGYILGELPYRLKSETGDQVCRVLTETR